MSSSKSFSTKIAWDEESSTSSDTAPSSCSLLKRGTVRRKVSVFEDSCHWLESLEDLNFGPARDSKLSLNVISYRTFQCPVNNCLITLSCSAVSLHFQREHLDLIGLDMSVGTRTELNINERVRTAWLEEKATPIKMLFLRGTTHGPAPFLVNSAVFQTKTDSFILKWLLVWLSSPYNFGNWFSVKLQFQNVSFTQACKPLAMQFEHNLQEIFDDDNVLIAHLPSSVTSFDLKRLPFRLEISVHSAEI